MSEESSPAPAPESAPASNGFSIGRTLLLLAGFAAVAGIVFVVMEVAQSVGGDLVKATGRVTWNGKPVTKGVVMAQHDANALFAPMGLLDEDGQFELLTNMEPGINVGHYKVRVAAFTEGMPPKPLVPVIYTTFEDSPLTIDVSSDPEKNVFKIELEGEAPGDTGPSPEELLMNQAEEEEQGGADAPASDDSTSETTESGEADTESDKDDASDATESDKDDASGPNSE